MDICFDARGTLRSRRGPPSGGGILDHKPKGACTPAIPLFSTSRIVTGAPLEGGIFKCALKSVGTALADGTYEPQAPDPASIAKLKQAFPQGVFN